MAQTKPATSVRETKHVSQVQLICVVLTQCRRDQTPNDLEAWTDILQYSWDILNPNQNRAYRVLFFCFKVIQPPSFVRFGGGGYLKIPQEAEVIPAICTILLFLPRAPF